jgi:hypothetical protein
MACRNQSASPAQPPLFHALYFSSSLQLASWDHFLQQNISKGMKIQSIATLNEMTASLIATKLHELQTQAVRINNHIFSRGFVLAIKCYNLFSLLCFLVGKKLEENEEDRRMSVLGSCARRQVN